MKGWPPRHLPALDVCCYRYKVEWDGCVQRSASNDHGHGGWLCPGFEPLTWLPYHFLGSGKQSQGQSPGLLTRSWLLGEPAPWTMGSGETLELKGQGLTFSSWVPSVDPVLPGPCHQAGKFDIIPTMTTIGSGIGIFGVVSAGRTCLLCWVSASLLHSVAEPQNKTIGAYHY